MCWERGPSGHALEWIAKRKLHVTRSTKILLLKELPENYLWATPWENLFLLYANNKDADQPANPRSLISVFVIRCLDSVITVVSITEISRLRRASVAEQAGLSLPWSQNPEDRFSRVVAPMHTVICAVPKSLLYPFYNRFPRGQIDTSMYSY